MGSKGLLTAFICAFATGIIYKFFIKRNITIRMPEQVPPNISQTFKDIIPFGVCLVFFWGFDFAFRNIFGFCFAQGVIQVFQPLFSAADRLCWPRHHLRRHVSLLVCRRPRPLHHRARNLRRPHLQPRAQHGHVPGRRARNRRPHQTASGFRRRHGRHWCHVGDLLHVRLPRQVQRDARRGPCLSRTGLLWASTNRSSSARPWS